jgi:hypothetical protein
MRKALKPLFSWRGGPKRRSLTNSHKIGEQMNAWNLSAVAGRVKTVTAVASLALIMVAASAIGAHASSTGWTVVSSPNATLSGGKIESVSCSAPQACAAVGTDRNTSGINVTLAERWDGTNWQRQATPNPPGNTSPSVAPTLLGVSCPAAGFCVAVGTYTLAGLQTSLAEIWNGTSWTLQSFPVPANASGAGLTAVSCTSPSFCEAVGSYFDTSSFLNEAFGAAWNGTSWSLQSTPNPNPGGFDFEQFNTVSCTSPTFCEAWAGGNAGNPGITVAEQWDGTSWSLQTVPSTATTVNSVSCVSAAFCEAVGPDQAFAWDGSAWNAQTIPAPVSNGNLSGVSCDSVKFCEAVGAYNNNGNDVGVAAQWDGKAWSAQTTSDPSKSTWTNLNAVSCVSAKACEAGGDWEVQVTSNDPKALAEAWTGKAWQLQRAATPAGATYNLLSAVSCVSASFCEAVGQRLNSAGNVANLAETWNGQSWSVQAIPDPQSQSGPGDNALYSVSCAAANFCEAVGAGGTGATTEMWNGTSWVVQTRPGAADVQPQVVSCASASYCLSADAFGHVDIWNGSSWSAGPAVAGFSFTGSLSCLSASFCEAVGEGPSGENAAAWNGTSWTDQATPGPVSASLNAVSCTAATSCEAVGQNLGPNDQTVTLADSWDGSAWTTQTTPNPATTQGSSLTSVSCASATSCTAIGQYQSSTVPSFGEFQTLAEVWDGTAWSVESTLDPSTGNNVLLGVSCGASQVCTAVGQAPDQGGVEATLIESGD